MAEIQIGPKSFADKVVNPCGCQLTVPPSEVSFTYCPMHKAAPEMLAALELLLGCADWESEDIATLNVTQFKASMDQATTAIAQARSQEVEA